ncbi:APOBEC1 complementation factor [Blattella germanica]|nr:APOBEC1 complementation factor [Blattella germanica]
MENRQTRKLLAFLESRPGFDILQTNGQRRYGRPTESPEPSPPRGSEVFVGKLPRNMFEDELVPVFEKVGSIFEIRMMMDFSGANRGFCFVKYSKPSEAERAIRELNNFEVRPGKYIGVVKSVDNCRLFFGGLPKDKTEEDVYNELVRHVDEVKEVIMYKSVIDKSKNRGFAFVEFRNHRAAAMARRKLVPNRVMFWGQYLQIDWAVPEPDVDEETMATVKVLFIRNVLLSTTEEAIGCAMSEGAPNSVTRVKRIKDFAFVHFSTREQAEKAMNHWNGAKGGVKFREVL